MAIKIVDKMPPDFRDPEKVHAVSKAISGVADDPFHILKQAGIDIEPELEEFRQFLAEISGKKPPAPKFKQVEFQNANLPESLKLEVLSILKALEFADYSESAKEKAIKKLTSMLGELSRERLTPENLQKIGLTAFAVEIIKRGEFDRVEEIKKL
ncbi:hypothetical protein E3E26_09345 [Thermococcus sp. LS1]|uniref:hypothetical protein n=1 Tax=Thermococcus sp. LS1 TaxID=1638259 RepID=UPI00143B77D1|nr:hypothetical protein [Thermococcus sp. LS1]NJD99981.1 hypothetical protein [Thermococcus sp. LS1]